MYAKKLIGCCMLFMLLPAAALANVTYSFKSFDASGTNATTGESQLTVTVLDVSAGTVGFRFDNNGAKACSITDIYFDDGALLKMHSNMDASSSSVKFSPDASPGNLPGGKQIGFVTTAGFSADSDPPAEPNGVHPGEWVKIYFELIDGLAYQDVLNSLSLGLTQPSAQGALRVGIHVQGFADGGSVSFVNNGLLNSVIPAPGAALLGFIGLGLVGWLKRKLA